MSDNQSLEVIPAESLSNQQRSMMETAISRAAQEVQAAMVIAKRFPRDANTAYTRIMQSCSRKGLAEVASYAYPRGGTTVTGPSIRLAEALKVAWGNIESGIVELEQKNGESIVMSYAWDLETNSKETKIFTVKHERHTRNGTTKLTDPRDIYELVANQGARRLRACILAVIPGDIVDSAVEKCDATLKGDGSEPLADRARKMLAAFETHGVTQGMIETRLGHKLDALIETELVQLRKIYNAIKDGAAKREDFFTFQNEAQSSTGAIGRVEKPETTETKKPEESAKTGTAEKTEPTKPSGPTAEELIKQLIAKGAQINLSRKLLSAKYVELGLLEEGQDIGTMDAKTAGIALDAFDQIRASVVK
jgi:hypothetical protein